MNNENRRVSRKRKKRFERKNKMDDNMKLLLNKIKTEKKKENKKIVKIRQLEIELVKIKNSNKPDKRKNALKELIKIHVVNKLLNEIRNEILVDNTFEFEMVGFFVIGGQNRQTHNGSRNIAEYEAYINAICQDYESEDAIFNGYIYKIDTPRFILVKRSQYGNGCDFKHKIIEYQGHNCFIPAKGYCFVKCIIFLTVQDFKQQNLDFFKNEKKRSSIMTKARIQPFCIPNNINLGYFDGARVFPRSVTERDNALFLYNNHLCVI